MISRRTLAREDAFFDCDNQWGEEVNDMSKVSLCLNVGKHDLKTCNRMQIFEIFPLDVGMAIWGSTMEGTPS